MRDKTAIVEELGAALAGPEAAEAAAGDRRAVGYFCSYVPPELISAAGLHPLRLMGLTDDSSSGDAYLSHLTCSYARHVTAAILDGAYDFLAGQISVNTCDHVRRANDAITAKSSLAWHGYLSVPRSFRASLLPWYLDELGRLRSSLADHFKVEIDDDALTAAIEKYNQVRDRVRKIDELRRAEEPRLSGTEALTAHLAARVMSPERFIELADELIAAVDRTGPITGIRARVVLAGSELDDPRFVRALESQGAHVAGDLLCFGARGMGQKVEPGPDPLESLARAYLYQLPCARMMAEFPGRFEELKRIYRECGARGIIFQRLKFCQIWSNEVHNLRHRFETEPLPLLVIEREYGMVSTGQLKTRVQAFLEKIESSS